MSICRTIGPLVLFWYIKACICFSNYIDQVHVAGDLVVEECGECVLAWRTVTKAKLQFDRCSLFSVAVAPLLLQFDTF